MSKRYKAIGLMSGTSMDGVDAAWVETDGELYIRLGGHCTLPYPAELRKRLAHAVAQKGQIPARELQQLDEWLVAIHAQAVAQVRLLENAGVDDVDIIGFHGHSIYHNPGEGVTFQLGDGKKLAQQTGVDVVYQLRRQDILLGGQGAPLVPFYHRALMSCVDRRMDYPVLVINIGGVANVTYLAADGSLGACDTGPGNAMLDDWIFRHTGEHYDNKGRRASRGTVHAEVLERWLAHPYFHAPFPKSLDRNNFAFFDDMENMTMEDGAATLTELTAASLAASLSLFPERPKRYYVTGGGRHNEYLLKRLEYYLRDKVYPIDTLNVNGSKISGDALEAQAFAFLAVRTLKGWPLTCETTTGITPASIAGGVFCPAC